MTGVGDPWHFGADIRIPKSVPLTVDTDPDPITDPTSFFLSFFLKTYPHVHHLLSFKLLKFCVKIVFCMHYFSPLNTLMRKGKVLEPDTYIWLIDPGGLKISGSCGSGSGSGSPTLDVTYQKTSILTWWSTEMLTTLASEKPRQTADSSKRLYYLKTSKLTWWSTEILTTLASRKATTHSRFFIKTWLILRLV